jgi:3-carboxy-cis,cis-muconate cycloisomerase
MILLGAKVGREVAHKLVEEATRKSSDQGKRLKDVLAVMKEVREQLSAHELETLEDPEGYLGSAEPFRRRLIAAVAQDQIRNGRNTKDRG